MREREKKNSKHAFHTAADIATASAIQTDVCANEQQAGGRGARSNAAAEEVGGETEKDEVGTY